MDQERIDPDDGSDEHKARTVRRHLRGAKRFEERKQNLIERKKRGHGPPSRMRDLDVEDDEFGEYEDEPRARARPRGRARDRPAEPNARVASVARTEVRVLTKGGDERVCKLLPKVQLAGGVVVGDAVELDSSDRVVARAERRTVLERQSPGSRHKTRVLAANVDVGLVVMAPRADGLSLGFLDRAIVALECGGVEPCVVVTKVDLIDAEARADVESELAPWRDAGVDVHLVGSPTGEGIDALRESLRGRVAVLFGHSGVGKSTLVNALDPGAAQLTGATRESDGRGRHTTTSSRLVPFLDGGALVDTPGVRQLAPDVADVDAVIGSIPELAPLVGECRYSDCAHVGEPGCAIEDAANEDPNVENALHRLRRLLVDD